MHHKDVGKNDIYDQSTLHVDWILVPADINTSFPNLSVGSFVIHPDRLMRMAERINELPFDCVSYSFTGAEPLFHPWFPHFLKHIGGSSRRITINFEICGKHANEQYIELASSLEPETGVFHINLSYVSITPANLIVLIAGLTDKRQKALVSLQSEDTEKHRQLREFLLKLREKVDFTLVFDGEDDIFAMPEFAGQSYAPAGPETTAQDSGNAEQAIILLDSETDIIIPANEQASPIRNSLEYSGQKRFCCSSHNFLHIGPNGEFGWGACGKRKISERYLWELKEGELAKHGGIVECQEADCPCSAFFRPPVFENISEAQAWTREFETKQIAAEWRIPETVSPFFREPSVSQRLRGQIRFLFPGFSISSDFVPPLEADSATPLLWRDICAIYSSLQDKAARKVFACALASALAANALPFYDIAPENNGLEKAPRAPMRGYLPEGGDASGHGKQIVLEAFGEQYRFNAAQAADCALPYRYFDYLALDLGAYTIPALLSLGAMIFDFQPDLEIRTSDADDFLRIAAWLEKRFPDFVRLFGYRDSTYVIFAHSRQKIFPIISASPDETDISLVVYADNETALANCLQKITIDNVKNVELLICAAAFSGDLEPVVEKYADRFFAAGLLIPEKDAVSLADLWNMAIGRARGKYIAFIVAPDWPGSAFLARGWDMLSRSGADMAIDGLAGIRACHIRYAPDALKEGEPVAFVNSSGYLPVLFKRSFLLDSFLSFSNLSLMEAAFLTRAIAASHFTQIIPCAPVSQNNLPAAYAESVSGAWSDLEDFCLWYEDFRHWHKTDLPKEAWSALLENIRANLRPVLAAEMRALDNDFQDLPGIDRLTALSPNIIRGFIKDCIAASVPCPGSVKLDAPDYNYASNAGCRAYNPHTAGMAPILSVILTNCGSLDNLEKCLRSIFSQDFRDYELIALDNHYGREIHERLRLYADINPRFRLAHMEAPVLNGICRNTGLDMAAGQYVIFVDGDDLLKPGYFSMAVAAMLNKEADAVFFSSDEVDADGYFLVWHKLQDGPLATGQAARMCLEGKLDAGVVGKIYLADFLKSHEIDFPQDTLTPDYEFIRRLLARSPKLFSCSFMGYSRRKTDGQKLALADSGLVFHALCGVMDSLKKYGELFPTASLYVWEKLELANLALNFLTGCFLPATKFRLSAEKVIVFAESDLGRLADNDMFCHALARAWGNFYANPDKKNIFPKYYAEDLIRVESEYPNLPLVSLIFTKSLSAGEAASLTDALSSMANSGFRMECVFLGETAYLEELKTGLGETLECGVVYVSVETSWTPWTLRSRGIDCAEGKYALFDPDLPRLECGFLASALKFMAQNPAMDFVALQDRQTFSNFFTAKDAFVPFNVEKRKALLPDLDFMAQTQPFCVFNRRFIQAAISGMAGQGLPGLLIWQHILLTAKNAAIGAFSCPVSALQDNSSADLEMPANMELVRYACERYFTETGRLGMEDLKRTWERLLLALEKGAPMLEEVKRANQEQSNG